MVDVARINVASLSNNQRTDFQQTIVPVPAGEFFPDRLDGRVLVCEDGLTGGVTPAMWFNFGRLNHDNSCRWIRVKYKVHLPAATDPLDWTNLAGNTERIYANHIRRTITIRDRETGDPVPPDYVPNATVLGRALGTTAPQIQFRLTFAGTNPWIFPGIVRCDETFTLFTQPANATNKSIDILDVAPLFDERDIDVTKKYRNGFRLPGDLNEFVVELEWEIPSSPEADEDPDEWRHIKFDLKIIRSLCVTDAGTQQSMPNSFIFTEPMELQILNCDSVINYAFSLNCDWPTAGQTGDHRYTIINPFPAIATPLSGSYEDLHDSIGSYRNRFSTFNVPPPPLGTCYAGFPPNSCIWRSGVLMVRDGTPGAVTAATLEAERDSHFAPVMSICLNYRDGYPGTNPPTVLHDHWGVGGEIIKWRSNNRTYPPAYQTDDDRAYAGAASLSNGLHAQRQFRRDPYDQLITFTSKPWLGDGGTHGSFGINHLPWNAGTGCPDVRFAELEMMKEMCRLHTSFRMRDRSLVNLHDDVWLWRNSGLPGEPGGDPDDNRVSLYFNYDNSIRGVLALGQHYPWNVVEHGGLIMGIEHNDGEMPMVQSSRTRSDGTTYHWTLAEPTHHHADGPGCLALVNGRAYAVEYMLNMMTVVASDVKPMTEYVYSRPAMATRYFQAADTNEGSREDSIQARKFGRNIIKMLAVYNITGERRMEWRIRRYWESTLQGLNRGVVFNYGQPVHNVHGSYGPEDPGFYPDFEAGETVSTGGESPLVNLVTCTLSATGSHQTENRSGPCGHVGPGLPRLHTGAQYYNANFGGVLRPNGPNYCNLYSRKWWHTFYSELACILFHKHLYNPTLPNAPRHPDNVMPQRALFLAIKMAFSEVMHFSTSEPAPDGGYHSSLDGTIVTPYTPIWGTGAQTIADRHSFPHRNHVDALGPTWRRPLAAEWRRWFDRDTCINHPIFRGWYPHELNGVHYGERTTEPGVRGALDYTQLFIVMWIFSYRACRQYFDGRPAPAGGVSAQEWRDTAARLLRSLGLHTNYTSHSENGWSTNSICGTQLTQTVGGENFFKDGNIFEYVYDDYVDTPTGAVTIDLIGGTVGSEGPILLGNDGGSPFTVSITSDVDITPGGGIELGRSDAGPLPVEGDFYVGSLVAGDILSFQSGIQLGRATGEPVPIPYDPQKADVVSIPSSDFTVNNLQTLTAPVEFDGILLERSGEGPLPAEGDFYVGSFVSSDPKLDLAGTKLDKESTPDTDFVVSLERVVTGTTDPRRVYIYSVRLTDQPVSIHPVLYAGNDVYFLLTLTDSAGSPIDLSVGVGKLVWTVYKNETSGSAILTKTLGAGVNVTNGPSGQFGIDVEGNETKDFSGIYYHECELTLNGHDTTLFAGPITFQKTFIL